MSLSGKKIWARPVEAHLKIFGIKKKKTLH
jgi:hypothetical protein